MNPTIESLSYPRTPFSADAKPDTSKQAVKTDENSSAAVMVQEEIPPEDAGINFNPYAGTLRVGTGLQLDKPEGYLQTKKQVELAENLFMNNFFAGNAKDAQEFLKKGGDVRDIPDSYKQIWKQQIQKALQPQIDYLDEAAKKEAPKMTMPEFDDNTVVMLAAALADVSANVIAGIAGGVSPSAQATQKATFGDTLSRATALLTADVEKYSAEKKRVDDINFQLRLKHGDNIEAIKGERAKLMSQAEIEYTKMENNFILNKMAAYEKMVGLTIDLQLKEEASKLGLEREQINITNQERIINRQEAMRVKLHNASQIAMNQRLLTQAAARQKQSVDTKEVATKLNVLHRGVGVGSGYTSNIVKNYVKYPLNANASAMAAGHAGALKKFTAKLSNVDEGEIVKVLSGKTNASSNFLKNIIIAASYDYLPKDMSPETLTKIAAMQFEAGITPSNQPSGLMLSKEDLAMFAQNPGLAANVAVNLADILPSIEAAGED